MKSSTVSKIISRIQFTLYSLLAFSLFSIILSYALLTYGLTIPSVSLPGFKAEQLYIKLDKKLTFYAKRIIVSNSNNSSGRLPLFNVQKLVPLVDISRKNFNSFIIDELNIENTKVTFSYKEEPDTPEENKITIHSKDMYASIYMRFYDDFLLLETSGSMNSPTAVSSQLQTILDFKTSSAYTVGQLSSSDKARIDFYLRGDGDTMAFSAHSNTFTDLGSIVDLFALEENVSKWIVEYNQAKDYQLLEAKGMYAYNNPKTIIDTLFIHAREKELNYSFHPKLFPISSPSTDVYFSKGILSIRPHTSLYNQHVLDDDSGVYIDFNHEHTILDIDLKTETTLDQEIVEIVNAYHIPLPLLQEKGRTDTHIKINIDLLTEEASAIGQFFIKESDLILDGVRYKVKNATARLHKGVLSIDSTYVNYEDIFFATINGQMDLTTLTGDFLFDVEEIKLPLSKEQDLLLSDESIRIQLSFDKKTHSYLLPLSHWKLGEQTILMEKNTLVAPIKFDSAITIKDLMLHMPNVADVKVDGTLDLGRAATKLDLELANIHHQDGDLNISSAQNVSLELHYDNNKTKLYTHQPSIFRINDNSIEILPTAIELKEGRLDINQTDIKLNGELFSRISTEYPFGAKSIEFVLQNTIYSSPEVIFIEPPFKLMYTWDDARHYVDSNDLDVHAVFNKDKSVELKIKDFSKLYPYSNTLHIYDVRAGSADLLFVDGRIGMDLTLKNFTPLLSKNGKDITTYHIKGQYLDDMANLRINKDIDVIYNKKGRLKAKNVDFNLFPIKEYLKNMHEKENVNDLDLSIVTQNCNVALGKSGRKILADRLNVKIKNDTIDAQLTYGKGAVLFQSVHDDFSMYGKGLNDKFLNNLVKFSTFKNGSLSLAVKGTYHDFRGIAQVDNTIIKDYTVLNNTLAFFNTIPSLVTFSVPGYSKNGLKVNEMYLNFDVNGSQLSLKDTKISSKELTITAKGKSDLEKETVDILMQVKTDIGSAAKDIPIIGYIIFGEDSVSTTVRVHGDLKDPTVESSLAKSVIVAPYNIIKRTISLPFKALEIFDSKDPNATEQAEKTD